MQKQLKKNFKINYITILLAIFCLFSFLPITAISSTKAEETIYSNVLDDLQKDESFNIEDYPLKENDYSLQVIQIAESNDKELFIYVYQPSGTHFATSINISTTINEEYFPHNYKLTLLNYKGTLHKYLVNDLNVSNEDKRYYDIPSIFRNFDFNIDEFDEDGEVSEKSYAVSKLFTATTENNVTTYTCEMTQTIEIDEKYVGYLRYENGFYLYKHACDSHFVAFSTDYEIDMLLEADVYYTSRSVWEYNHLITGSGMSFGDIYENEVHLNRYKEVNVNVWGQHYNWERIQSVDEFIKNEDLTSSAKQSLNGKQWVLRFVETPYDYSGDLIGWQYDKNYINVRNISILRLKFETNGKVYNLGVVDNKQTGDGVPDNNQPSPPWWIWLILGFLCLIILLPIFPGLFNFFVKTIEIIFLALKWLFKGIWYVISAPFSVVKKE